ncbi:MAG: HEAT repeat domain-containing protein [Elusimicrobiota bacterium]
MRFGTSIILFTFFCITGCAVTARQKVPVAIEKVDEETAQKVRKTLEKVRKMASQSSLDYLGRNTMNESVMLMDLGPAVSSILVEELRTTSDWKYRFWLVDMLGFLPTPDNIIPLIEVLEDYTENVSVRLRACESLKELKYREAVEHLMISRDMVKSQKIAEKIDESIGYLR